MIQVSAPRKELAGGVPAPGGGEAQAEYMILYLDVYFLMNLLMDFLLLELAGHFLNRKGDARRCLSAAAAAAGGTAIAAVLGWNYLWQRCAIGTAEAFLMARIAFGRGSAKEQLMRTLTLFLSGLLLGGGLELAVSCQPKVGTVLPGGVLLTMLIRAAFSWLRQYRNRQALYCRVHLEHCGRSTEVSAMLDTGNRLYEPYSHQPVHVITQEPVKQICSTVSELIYIPYSSVGRECGVLPAIRIDRMTVQRENEEPVAYDHPWLAISPHPLSPARRYEMLLHTEKG